MQAPRVTHPVELRGAHEHGGPTDCYQWFPTPRVHCLRRSDGLGAVCLTTTLTYFGSPSGGGAKLAADSTTRVVRSLSDGTVIFCPPGTYSGCLSRMATQSFRASSCEPCAGCPPDASSLAQSPRWRRSASTRAAVRAEPSALAGWLILTWSTLREPLVASVRRTVRCRLCCLRRERWRRSAGAAACAAETSAPARSSESAGRMGAPPARRKPRRSA